MFISINIRIVFETGKLAPKCITRVSAKVRRAIVIIITTIITVSRFRLLSSSTVREGTDFMYLFLIMAIQVRAYTNDSIKM